MDVVKLVQSMTDAEKDEVAKALEKEKNKQNENKWKTEPKVGEYYWYIDALLDTQSYKNVNTNYDDSLIKLGVCTNKGIVENRAFNERLSRTLWKFKLENDNVELDWEKWFVVSISNKLCVEATCTEFIAGVTYFSTKEIAKRAIKEVVEPMLNMEM